MEKEFKYFTEIRDKNENLRVVKSAPINLDERYGKKIAERITKAILTNCTGTV